MKIETHKFILLITILFIFTSCANQKYLDNSSYCENDNDCNSYCCSNIANKYWIEKNINPQMECCAPPKEGKLHDGAKCVNNKCEGYFEEPIINPSRDPNLDY